MKKKRKTILPIKLQAIYSRNDLIRSISIIWKFHRLCDNNTLVPSR